MNGTPLDLKITLADIHLPLVAAFERFCGDLDFVTIHEGSILDAHCDAIVSPANSYGFMDGGIDQVYTDAFGPGVQQRLQQIIRERHHGELLVGAAEIVETGAVETKYVISAPTMRVPMILDETPNPYLAARAALLLVQNGVFREGAHEGHRISDHVKRLGIPGLGTGVGRVNPSVCALQIRKAIDDVILGQYEFPRSWREAQLRHLQLYTDRADDL